MVVFLDLEDEDDSARQQHSQLLQLYHAQTPQYVDPNVSPYAHPDMFPYMTHDRPFAYEHPGLSLGISPTFPSTPGLTGLSLSSPASEYPRKSSASSSSAQVRATPETSSSGSGEAPTKQNKGKGKMIPGQNHNDCKRLQSLFRVMGIYPCIRSIVENLDRTDLYNLSSTCRDMHLALLENRRHLIPFTLRCNYREKAPLSYGFSRPGAFYLNRRVNMKCASDLVNPCERCKQPVCRNCKAKPVKFHRDAGKRATCLECSSVSISTLTEDPSVKMCVCKPNGESWFCKNCASPTMENYILKTDKNGSREVNTVSIECGRGGACVGTGWYKCGNFHNYLDSAGRGERIIRKGKEARYACAHCRNFMFSKAEEKEFRALRA